MAWPSAPVVIKTLGSSNAPGRVTRVELLGHRAPLTFTQSQEGLKVTFPPEKSGDHAFALKIDGLRLG
jgi:hypothetical protein